MFFPKLIPYDVKESGISEFKGINRGKVCSENEFYDTLNLSCRDHPLLSTAPEVISADIGLRDTEHAYSFYNKGLYTLAGGTEGFSIRTKERESVKFSLSPGLCKGNVFNFNEKTIVIKDKYAYELDTDELTVDMMGYIFNADERETFKLSLVYTDGSEIGDFSTGSAETPFPDKASVGDCFAKGLSFYRLIYNDTANPENNEWQVQTSFRLRFDIPEAHRHFKKGDFVKLSGIKYWNWTVRELKELERFIRIDNIDENGRYITEETECFDNMTMILSERSYPSNDIVGYDKPFINNIGNELCLLEGKISACMPEMKFALECKNRVWGCNSEKGEIYASELGNPRNFSVFEGISSDSYAVSIGSYGDFTACCSYLGSPVFFKENELIVINGSRPSNYSLESYSCRGVSADSPDGLCTVNDVLYYKSNDGIYAYSGSRPRCVSQDLGDGIRGLKKAVLGGEGDMLFVSGEYMGESVHYSYDTLRGIWHGYTSPHTVNYVNLGGITLEFCKDDGKYTLRSLYSAERAEEVLENAEKLEKEWFFETGDMFYNTPDHKYPGRIKLDLACDEPCTLLISYDSGEFRKLRDIPPLDRGSCDISFFPRRCERFRLRMEGRGVFTLYSITKLVEEADEDG
ncbi:MAG: hypothetical protein E7652_04700 [Ruminococcaceae bacterium]|nr:hypothetical protein [Oscillospiraceae bacterium]